MAVWMVLERENPMAGWMDCWKDHERDDPMAGWMGLERDDPMAVWMMAGWTDCWKDLKGWLEIKAYKPS